MAIKSRGRVSKIEIDLSGPDGNAYALLRYAIDYGKQLHFPKEKINQIITDMKSSDYENLIQIFDKHFGHIVDLIR